MKSCRHVRLNASQASRVVYVCEDCGVMVTVIPWLPRGLQDHKADGFFIMPETRWGLSLVPANNA